MQTFVVERKIYYWYLKYKRKPKKQNERSVYLQKLILKVYNHNVGVSYKRIVKILQRDFNENIAFKSTYYHMWKHRIKSNRTSEVKNTKKGYRDLIKRNFKTYKPNKEWFTDITYVQIKICWNFLSAIIDIYDKSFVAYHFGKENNVDLVCEL